MRERKMAIWIDDTEEIPSMFGRPFRWKCRSTRQAIAIVEANEIYYNKIVINIDTDLGEYEEDGGGVKGLVAWLIRNKKSRKDYEVLLHGENIEKFQDELKKWT